MRTTSYYKHRFVSDKKGPERQAEIAEHEQAVAEFLASGGKVDVIPSGRRTIELEQIAEKHRRYINGATKEPKPRGKKK